VAEKEVDFVARSQQAVVYDQSASSVLDENPLKRERAPLKAIPDHHPKVLLTLDTIGSDSTYEGIAEKNLVEWLLEEREPDHS